MRQLARETYDEMVGAGYGVVGEFHYVHHQPDGTPYPEPNEMALAVAEAAAEAGLAIVLLPAAYHRGGWSRRLGPAAGAGSAALLRPRRRDVPGAGRGAAGVGGVGAGGRVGVAAHSVRAVPRGWLEAIATYSERHGMVRHVHASEQRRELAECQAEHGCSPIELLERTGFLGPRASVIHGIHVSAEDVAILARAARRSCRAPRPRGTSATATCRRWPTRRRGVPLAIGSDSQVRIDPFEEARELETGSRRERQLRAGLLAAVGDLWGELCRNGYRSLGLDAELVRGRTVEIDLEHPDLRGRRLRGPAARAGHVRLGRRGEAVNREQRLVFGEVAEQYDRHRPAYPDALVDDLVELAGLEADALVLEVGAGTGKATSMFAARGIRVLAVEPSAEMAAVARRVCAGYREVRIEQADFERWDPAGREFALMFAAQAWHWVEPAVGFAKAASVLRPGGVLGGVLELGGLDALAAARGGSRRLPAGGAGDPGRDRPDSPGRHLAAHRR